MGRCYKVNHQSKWKKPLLLVQVQKFKLGVSCFELIRILEQVFLEDLFQRTRFGVVNVSLLLHTQIRCTLQTTVATVDNIRIRECQGFSINGLTAVEQIFVSEAFLPRERYRGSTNRNRPHLNEENDIKRNEREG